MSWVISNWINSEDISSIESLNKGEHWLSRATDFFNKGKYQIKKTNSLDYSPGAERVNEEWMDASFWFVPERYISVELGSHKFEVSVHAYLNEELRDFMVEKRYKKQATKIINSNKQRRSIERELTSKYKELSSLHDNYSDELKKVVGKLQRYIRKNAVSVGKYEGDRNTRKMLELIYNAELAYRGILCGNDFAYDWLIIEYLEESQVRELIKHTAKIVELSKEYIVLQLAVKHWKGKSTTPKIYDAKELFETFNIRLTQVEITHENIKAIFQDIEPEVILDPTKNYVFESSGNINKDAVATELAKIFTLQNKDGESISSKRIKQLYGRDWAKMT